LFGSNFPIIVRINGFGCQRKKDAGPRRAKTFGCLSPPLLQSSSSEPASPARSPRPFREDPSMRRMLAVPALTLLAAGLLFSALLPAQKAKPPVPHGQDRLPGPALKPHEALAKMTVPPGFSVELVAAEPDLVNPVAMCFDEKGRVWVTESLEYPRREPGPGRDRVKCLEIGPDGKASKVTVFADGLNIPSGIAVGHGGVWVANAPDILFYKVGPDGRAAGKPEVVVTGFGRTDTHELPNSLTWGPDGWLYGWNGVFNHSHVKHKGKQYDFTCAIFRIHPKTRDFELFCEGTSNPWGLAIDGEGSFFASACVIDHLWHLVETGYYHRQGGPYPPFTWKIGSIVKHKHQKAAYCGLTWFDSDAYPPEYREKLYMGNIHGGCINSDELTRDGSTYFAKPRPDFLTANDQWFMPVVQKVGPDGCLYILDWYDRYHCYQDANRDPKGIDRLNGRLYRVRYKDTPRAPSFDLSKESDDELIKQLGSANVFYRDVAQRILTERASPELSAKLRRAVLDRGASRKARLHALWSLVGAGAPGDDFLAELLKHDDPTFRAWGARALGESGKMSPTTFGPFTEAVKNGDRDVLLQAAIAARKLKNAAAPPILIEALARCGDDKLIPHIVWQNLHPSLETGSAELVAMLKKRGSTPNLGKILPRVVERLLAARKPDPGTLVELYSLARDGKSPDVGAARQVLALLTTKVETGEVGGEVLREKLAPLLRRERESAGDGDPLYLDATFLAAVLGEKEAIAATRRVFETAGQSESRRVRALEVLIAARESGTLDTVAGVLGDAKKSAGFKGEVLARLSRLDSDRVPAVVLGVYDKLDLDIRPRAVELLTQRPAWGKALLRQIADKKISPSVLNVNQARRLLAGKDAELAKLVTKHYGTIREGRSPEREKVVTQMRRVLETTKGDPHRGVEVYKKLCAQCHKLHGQGEEVGPDITLNGRASFEQLLNNVFDPNLVIGEGYLAVSVETTKGRALTGLLVEDSPSRVVLKVQGGKQEVVARKDVEAVQTSKLGLMPEDVEKQLKPQEIADLFALLALDLPPGDPKARWIPGTPRGLKGER
jgi:putative membrane-bound dehydrogenase-like protein